MEDPEIKAAIDVIKTTISVAEKLTEKLWTLIDAASEKKTPGEVLTQQGIQAMQGNMPG